VRHKSIATVIAVLAAGPWALLSASAAARADTTLAARDAQPVVLQGALLPDWSRLPAEGIAKPYPSGANQVPGADRVRDAHNGTLVVPPDSRQGVPVDRIAAYSWGNGGWVEVPVQVDQRFPYFLANGNSSFAVYSGTDEELTYQWDVESWRKTAGTCDAQYPPGVSAMQDPVPTLDDDDEISFYASDAGAAAPGGALGPPHTAATRQQIALVDPLDPSTVRYVYLFLKPGGSSFNRANGYVRYQRDANADEWIDRYSFPSGDTEQLGTSNTGYGPNLSGTVCRTAPGLASQGFPQVADGTPRPSTDRFPRDGVTVTTRSYRWRASGRWMVRGIQVAKPGQPFQYGPDLIDRWKGRAFQQSPDSTVSVVGFEDEQVNWEANSALLGERSGPVRAIREVWGADSGTNVTKTETFYRDAITYHYHLRVHPIPPDGIYTSWDYNHGVAARYYNVVKPDGVAIDGVNDDAGNVDSVLNQPAYFDVPDPTFDAPADVYHWDQVSGRDDAGSLVYVLEVKGPTTAENPAAVPYYRDDACFDDGTGDDPVARPWPGESSTDPRVKDGYSAENGGTAYANLTCDQKQGAWGENGVHFFFTNDTDNAFGPKPTTEVDSQQWQFLVPTAAPHSVGEPYAEDVRAPLQPVAVEQANTAARKTSLSYTGATSGTVGDPATLAATLQTDDGDAAANQPVDFSFQGATYRALTDASGTATVSVPVAAPKGSTQVGVGFAGGGGYLPSDASAAFEALARDVTLSLQIPPRRSWNGATGTMTATLVDAATGAGVSGRTVRFTVAGRPWQTAQTDAAGRAPASTATSWKDGTTVQA
jgi:hypothetical protein